MHTFHPLTPSHSHTLSCTLFTHSHAHISAELQDGFDLGGIGGEENGDALPHLPHLSIRLLSSKERVELSVKGTQVYSSQEKQRGMHVFVLNQSSVRAP